MTIETITVRDDLLIRRMVLQPGESMYWHIDLCHRFTVVVQGSRIGIEYANGSAGTDQLDEGQTLAIVDVHPGLADWEAPESRIHRATNLGDGIYEEVVTFFRDSATVEPQPDCSRRVAP